MITGRPEDGAYAQYVIVPVNQAAILPDEISYTNGVVVPFALVAAVHALSNKVPGAAMPGVSTPALGLPFPSLKPSPIGKSLVVYGGSSSVGAMTIQLAKAAGIYVSFISSGNFPFTTHKHSRLPMNSIPPQALGSAPRYIEEVC